MIAAWQARGHRAAVHRLARSDHSDSVDAILADLPLCPPVTGGRICSSIGPEHEYLSVTSAMARDGYEQLVPFGNE